MCMMLGFRDSLEGFSFASECASIEFLFIQSCRQVFFCQSSPLNCCALVCSCLLCKIVVVCD